MSIDAALEPESHSRLLAPLATIPAAQMLHGDADWFPPVDILEDAYEYLFKIDLPDVRPEDIHVVVEEDGLFISGERPPADPEGKQCLRIERPHGHFERRFALPEDASRAEIEPLFKESVLILHVPKLNGAIPTAPAKSMGPKLRLRTNSQTAS